MSTVLQFPEGAHLTAKVAEEVRALKGRRNATQQQIADALGVSQGQVSKRLRGQIAFNTDEIAALAKFFGVHPAELLGGSPPTDNGGAREATTGRYPGKVVTLREVLAMNRLPTQSVAVAA